MSTLTTMPGSGISMPTGTVTFLFTDIEGSTKRWEQYPRAMQATIALHDALLREAIEANGGYVFKTVGDAFCAAFPTAPQAVNAALAGQRALRAADWGPVGPIKVRMALHTGVAQVRDNDYFGLPLNRVARLLSAGYGEQILLSLATEQLVRDHLPPHTELKHLGEGGLKDLARAEHVYQLVTLGLPSDFPPLKALDTEYVGPIEAVVELHNPYKGLRAFQQSDAADFFGREALTERLVQTMGEQGPLNRFLAVVGPSGSGKSSVVRAGLVPALRAGKLPGSDRRLIVEMLPGPRPLEELDAVLLSIAANPPDTLMGLLKDDERGLIRAARRVLPTDESVELVLVIDQFEEVFTLIGDETARVHFLGLLCAAVKDPRSRVRVVITLRADFFDRPLLYPDPGELVRQRTEVVLPLNAVELERAIVKPAQRVGVSLEAELIASIIKDVGEQPGALPLLQYAMTELFEQRTGQMMTLQAYRDSGGVTGALARRADEIYEGLTGEEKEACRQLYLRLITLGEGVEDTRRRARRAELASILGDTQALDRVIEAYGKYRLLTLDMDPVTKGPTVEVAHEALIRTWGRLKEWLDESRADLRVQRQLMAEAAEWVRSGNDPSYLATGARLAQFEALVEGASKPGGVALTTEEKEYVQASIEGRERQEKAEKERQARELALARQVATSQKRAASRLRYLLDGAMVFLVVAAILALWALNQSQVAQTNATHADALRLSTEANFMLVQGQYPQAIALLAIRSMHTEYTPQGDAVLAGAMNLAYPLQVLSNTSAYWAAGTGMSGVSGLPANYLSVGWVGGGLFGGYMLTARLDGTVSLWDVYAGKDLWTTTGNCPTTVSPRGGVALSADGKYGLFACKKDALLLDGQTGKEVRRFSGHTGAVGGVTFSHDGKYVLTGSEDKTVRLWDTNTGKELHRFEAAGAGDKVGAGCVAFLPDDRRIFTVVGGYCGAPWNLSGGTVRLWDIATGAVLHEFPFVASMGYAWTVDSKYRYIVVQAEKEAQVWDTDTGKKLASFPVVFDNAKISTDGKMVATADSSGTVTLWDTQTGARIRQFTDLKSFGGDTLAFSLDGKMLAGGDGSGAEVVWDVQSGAILHRFTGHNGGGDLQTAIFSPDGQYLLTCDPAGIMLWSLRAPNGLPQFVGHTAGLGAIFTPDGKRVVTFANDNTARVWDAQTGQTLQVLTGHTAYLNGAAVSPDGKRVLTTSSDNTARMWDLQTGQELHRFDLPGAGGDNGVAISPDPDGRYALMSGRFATRMYDLHTYTQVYTLTTGNTSLTELTNQVSFSPDGKYAVTASGLAGDFAARLWDLSNGKLEREFKGHTAPLESAVFSPDGKYILTGSSDGTARLWDVASGKEVRRFMGHTGDVFVVAFSHDGKLAATSNADTTARIWDVATGKELRRLQGHTDAVWTVAFSPDDKMLLTGSADNTARLWYVDYHDEESYLCGKLLRDFTPDERAQFEIKDTTPTCPKP
jgi:WD40 repeat protein/class 3 adenylate cyclase